MLEHQLILPDGILILKPAAPLEAADFAVVASEIDPYIAKHGKLAGLLVHVKALPGWENLEAVVAHVRFVESHHQKIERLAIVSDVPLTAELPEIVNYLVHPQIKHFAESAYEDALKWLRE